MLYSNEVYELDLALPAEVWVDDSIGREMINASEPKTQKRMRD